MLAKRLRTKKREPHTVQFCRLELLEEPVVLLSTAVRTWSQHNYGRFHYISTLR